jgi:hypothetical protein
LRASDGGRLIRAAKRALDGTDGRDDAIQSSSNGCAIFTSGKLSIQIDGTPAVSAPHEFAATPQSKGAGGAGRNID